MNLGLTDDEYAVLDDLVLRPLRLLGAEVYCFGSRARGDYKRGSDLDLMVVHPGDISRELSEIRENIEESNFPYPVELVEEDRFSPAWLERYKHDRVPA